MVRYITIFSIVVFLFSGTANAVVERGNDMKNFKDLPEDKLNRKERKYDEFVKLKRISLELILEDGKKVRTEYENLDKGFDFDMELLSPKKIIFRMKAGSVEFDSELETIEIVHTVRDPLLFAIKAIRYGLWLLEQPKGKIYSMHNVDF
jgi:hypothetical protein